MEGCVFKKHQKNMKILMLGWELPPHNSGGLGVACYHMSKALANHGADIDFILPYDAFHPDTEHMNVVPATEITPENRQNSTFAYANGVADFSPMSKIQDEYIEYVKNHAKKVKPAIIHAHDWLTMRAGVAAKKASGSPLVVHVHATEFDRSGECYGNPVIHDIEQTCLLMADKIFTVSVITKNILIKEYSIPAEKIEVVYNSLDTSKLQPYGYSSEFTSYPYLEMLKKEGYTVITTIARYTVQKGLPHFMKAAARACERYDRLVFLLAGDGELRDELIQMAADNGISDKVFFTGFVRGKKWRDVYSVADTFVMSSVSEPFGLTALEAAHHSCSLIISKQSGVGEVLHSILRYDFWDTDKLADQMVAVALSSSLQNELTNNVAEEYLRISWMDVAKQCMDLYHSVRYLNNCKKEIL